jgi:hypothetical protein
MTAQQSITICCNETTARASALLDKKIILAHHRKMKKKTLLNILHFSDLAPIQIHTHAHNPFGIYRILRKLVTSTTATSCILHNSREPTTVLYLNA